MLLGVNAGVTEPLADTEEVLVTEADEVTEAVVLDDGVGGCGAIATPLYSVLPHARAIAVAVYVYVSNLTIKLPTAML